MTINGRKNLAHISAVQAKAQQNADAARRGANMTPGHYPRRRAALFEMARAGDRHVAVLEKHRRRAEIEANTADSVGPRRSRNAHGFFGKS